MTRSFLACGLALLAAAGCGKKESGAERVVTWTLNSAETLARSSPEARPTTQKRLEGMDVVLELRGDNTFTLTIRGGSDPQVATGTYKVGFDNVFLTRKVVDGKPARAGDDWKLEAGPKHVVVPTKDVDVVLTKR
jgi:hypothetical protein